ncbi:UNVERIFIED_CONTAM: hypothetical protein HDU68_004040 [Siphonaria sp. JEL0065]|nr:hypothetical protein HDU68_004040 [Siphonaria sp. JEL0065]
MLRQLVPARNSAIYWDNMLTGFGDLNWQPPLSVPVTAPMPLQLPPQPLVVLSNPMRLPRTVVDQSPITPLPFSPSIATPGDTKTRLCNTVPILASCAAVDSYFELIKTQETETNLEYIKTNHIKTSKVWFDILDHCEIRDRPKVIQVMQPLIGTDHQHIVHFQEHISDFVGQQPPEHKHKETVNVDCFRNGISHIPSLRTLEASLAVEELCDGFLHLINVTNVKEVREGLLRVKLLLGRLYEMCKGDEDRDFLTLAIDIGRERNKSLVIKLFNSVSLE